ncbi:hypothetical protein GCM10009819_32020 [Agromyces tropicus]|uniref:DUF4190 domain-containing protein n=1 Tax=Agromyces tropicus TaxID=555371 RepID=A0ABN2UTB5_9MICO
MLGGVALLLAVIPILNMLGVLVGLVGIVLGVVALLRRGRAKVTAIIGVPLSVVALALSVLLVATYAAPFTGWVEAIRDAGGSTYIVGPEPLVFEPDSSVPADGGLGLSPEDPAPLGSTVQYDTDPRDSMHQGWEVSLGTPNLDATAEVEAAYPFSDLEPGEQYASVPVTFTNLGSLRATPAVQMTFEYVTPGLQVVEKPWINMPDTIEAIGGLEPGESGTGNVIIPIPSTDADHGLWSVRFYLNSQPVYFGTPSAG